MTLFACNVPKFLHQLPCSYSIDKCSHITFNEMLPLHSPAYPPSTSIFSPCTDSRNDNGSAGSAMKGGTSGSFHELVKMRKSTLVYDCLK